jgi:hypothetical protein
MVCGEIDLLSPELLPIRVLTFVPSIYRYLIS